MCVYISCVCGCCLTCRSHLLQICVHAPIVVVAISQLCRRGAAYAGGDAQYAVLEFDALRKILNQYPTDNYTLRLEYRGHLNDEMTGFYRSSYVDSQNNT